MNERKIPEGYEDWMWDGESFISPEEFHARFELVDGEWRKK